MTRKDFPLTICFGWFTICLRIINGLLTDHFRIITSAYVLFTILFGSCYNGFYGLLRVIASTLRVVTSTVQIDTYTLSILTYHLRFGGKV